MPIEERGNTLVVIDEVFGRGAGCAMAGIHVVHPRDRFAEPTQRVVHLARVVGRHVRVLCARNEQQRRSDAIGVEDGRVCDVLLRCLPQCGADAILAFLGGVHVAHAESW